MDGTKNGEAFTALAEIFLAPTLAPGDVVILDILPARKVSGARIAIELAGATLPIAAALIAGLQSDRACVATAAARTVGALETAIASALGGILPA